MQRLSIVMCIEEVAGSVHTAHMLLGQHILQLCLRFCTNVAVCASLPCTVPNSCLLLPASGSARWQMQLRMCHVPCACINTYSMCSGAEHWHTTELWQRLLHTNCLLNCLRIHSTSVLVHTHRQLQPAGHCCCTRGILIPADSAELLQQPARECWVQQPKLRRLWAAFWQQWLWCAAVWQCICCTSNRHCYLCWTDW